MSTATATPPTTGRATPDEVWPDPEIPILVSIPTIATLLPSYGVQTIYRWRQPRNGKPPILPPPVLVEAHTPLWRFDAIRPILEAKAAAKGVELEPDALEHLLARQGDA